MASYKIYYCNADNKSSNIFLSGLQASSELLENKFMFRKIVLELNTNELFLRYKNSTKALYIKRNITAIEKLSPKDFKCHFYNFNFVTEYSSMFCFTIYTFNCR